MARIYMASKTIHAPRWREMRASGLPIVSTWIDEAGHGESPDKADLWRRNIVEASTATALVSYRHDDAEELKGALVEIGAALAGGVPVFWVGPSGRYTVVYHAGIQLCGSLDVAMSMARHGLSVVEASCR